MGGFPTFGVPSGDSYNADDIIIWGGYMRVL